MLCYILAAVALVTARSDAAAPPRQISEPLSSDAATAPAGSWRGVLSVGGQQVSVEITLANGASGWAGTVSASGQGSAPLTAVVVTGPAIRFSGPAGLSFEGRLLPDGSIEGIWTQSGLHLETHFQRVSAMTAKRVPLPDEPRAPLPYRSVEVSFDNRAGHSHLAGTLTLPKGSGPFPAAVLITGSGSQDRDETILGHKPFLVLADHLTRGGIAVLRLDDRGVGGSTGDVEHATTRNLGGDILAALSFLRTRQEIDSHRLGLIGHSEGGIIAPMLAADGAPVAWMVLLAGPGVRGDLLIEEQQRRVAKAAGLSPEAIAKAHEVELEVVGAAKAAPDERSAFDRINALLLAAGLPRAQAEQQAKRASSDWFRELLRYDPAPALRKTKVPLLAVVGGLDLQVPADQNLPALKADLASNAQATVIEVPGVNHLLESATTGSIAEYAVAKDTVSPALLGVLDDWLGGHVLAPPHGR